MDNILTRKEIMPGVFLNHLSVSKFKSACISISLITQLNKDTANLCTLLPQVLRRGTASSPNIEAISARLDEMYGSDIDPLVRRFGEIQCIGFFASFAEGRFLPEGSDILNNIVGLASEMLLDPLMSDGLLYPEYVNSEKSKLADLLRSKINDKRRYAITRCIEEMCVFEDYSAGRYKSADECENITAEELTDYYRTVLSTSPMEIFYCGSEPVDYVVNVFSSSLKKLKRGKINYDVGTDVRMNSIEETPRYYEENLDVAQGNLVMGFRLGDCMENPDIPSLLVFNAIFGGDMTSKLFSNVRERLSLCYTIGSITDRNKGVMFVSSGIDFDRYDDVKNEILHQLDEIRSGNISDNEIAVAKAGLKSDFISGCDHPQDLESFYFTTILDGTDYTPESLAQLVCSVSKQDVVNIASSLELDLIYFLRNYHD